MPICELCGSPVRVVSNQDGLDEGHCTNHYKPLYEELYKLADKVADSFLTEPTLDMGTVSKLVEWIYDQKENTHAS
jgi:hypothetical protein